MNRIQQTMWAAALGLASPLAVWAATPVWTFSAPMPAQAVVTPGGAATVVYTVTNQSTRLKNLVMQQMAGVSASPCALNGRGSTCTLIVSIKDSAIPEQGLHQGPVLCEQNNPNQCYQPSAANQLNVVRSQSGPTLYTVSASGDANVTPSPLSQSIAEGTTGTINLTLTLGYSAQIASDTCGGNLGWGDLYHRNGECKL